MVAKLSLLDSAQLDYLESKISNINAKIEQLVNVQNSLTQDPEKEKKVGTYSYVERMYDYSKIVTWQMFSDKRTVSIE